MTLLCLIGLHHRSLTAITRRGGTQVSLCERCGRPMIKQPNGKWVVSEPLA